MSSHSYIDTLCNRFDDYNNDVEGNKLVVEKFLNDLKSKYKAESNFFIKGSEFIGIGSSYEHTAASPKVGFNIAMILPPPFTLEYFTCVTLEEPVVYKLQCPNAPSSIKTYLDPQKFLLTKVLLTAVFSELLLALQSMTFEDYTITFIRKASKFLINLKQTQHILTMKIVPQIEGSINNIPGLKLGGLPWIIKKCITSNEMHVLLNLSCPSSFENPTFKHIAVEPFFSLLEKEALLHSDVLGYSICIAKAVSRHYKWNTKGLRTCHIKLAALSVSDQIELNTNPWIGYTLIMGKLISLLKNEKIDENFCEKNIIICKDKKICRELAKKINEVYKKALPDRILNFLESAVKVGKEMNPSPTTSEISLPTQNVNMDVPSFMKDDSFTWFEMLEARLFVKMITADEAKFLYAFSALPNEIATQISRTTISERKFSALKQIVIDLCDKKKSEDFNQMISTIPVTDQPSLYLQEIRRIAETLGIAGDIVRSQFIEVVPSLISPILHSLKKLPLTELGKLADDLMSLIQSVRSSETKGDKSPLSSNPLEVDLKYANPRAVICNDHVRFGQEARTCTTWCQWPNKDGALILDVYRSSSSRPVSPAFSID